MLKATAQILRVFTDVKVQAVAKIWQIAVSILISHTEGQLAVDKKIEQFKRLEKCTTQSSSKLYAIAANQIAFLKFSADQDL